MNRFYHELMPLPGVGAVEAKFLEKADEVFAFDRAEPWH